MDSTVAMEIKPLTSLLERKAIIDQWLASGLQPAEADTIQEDMLGEGPSSSHWFGVVDKNNGMIIAVFDVRHVPLESPDYHKSMRIHFRPDLTLQEWGVVGLSPEKIDDILTKTVSALFTAFRHMVTGAESTSKHMVKIYSAHPLKLLLFQEFARGLAEEAPDQYVARSYKNWVEIKHV